ncbi:uncharacterized protein EKO05_0005572 [Ascochyta rabiei]|uniref:Carbon-sulfur lyase n=1 Tax=Didymella rabiei TaxID=5454 RepID=A0A163KW69_DIDRA|nr:uncharacterized protein EKO05_0005572 [Ascochyta rabiei]KZM27295.1 carbon-sulfur lyase [Ascochyta rabiei]UPX15113.1 hypothetical protein EKO05_0005572 [Ascochyta rabiei]
MPDGRCNCAGIKVSIAELPKESVICYCGNCRRAGSTPGSIVYMFDKSEVTINDPKSALKSYTDSDTTSGNTIIRQFCSNCGCPIASLLSEDSPKIILKGGLFDHIPRPGVTSFEQNQPKWLEIAKA